MKARRYIVTGLLAAGIALACADNTGPEFDSPLFKKGGGSKPADSSDVTFVATPTLETYEASFWAVPHETRNLQIQYQVVGKNGKITEYPFLKFQVPAEALVQREDGTPIAEGDSVLITVSVDSTGIKASMGPSGLQFSDSIPTMLRLWYSGANGDLNGDGRVSRKDKQIESEFLSVWYQAQPGDPWEPVQAEHNLADDWFEVQVHHFSGFAVAY